LKVLSHPSNESGRKAFLRAFINLVILDFTSSFDFFLESVSMAIVIDIIKAIFDFQVLATKARIWTASSLSEDVLIAFSA